MEERFRERWPSMFAQVYCGFSLPEGWETIVWKLCERLEKVAPETTVGQVKEKFGGLRFYVDNCTTEGLDTISFFERMSFYVCETCGTTQDVTSEGGWILTLCKECRNVRESM